MPRASPISMLSRACCPGSGFIFGAKPGSIDAAICGFIANIYFYDIDTPLKQCLLSRENLVADCRAIHAAL
jgi:hypothetical protein